MTISLEMVLRFAAASFATPAFTCVLTSTTEPVGVMSIEKTTGPPVRLPFVPPVTEISPATKFSTLSEKVMVRGMTAAAEGEETEVVRTTVGTAESAKQTQHAFKE